MILFNGTEKKLNENQIFNEELRILNENLVQQS